MHDCARKGYASLAEIKAFYHVSPTLFPVGTRLTPQRKKNFACSQEVIYLADAPSPHYTVEEIARQDAWYVYRVEPVGKVGVGTCHDLTCKAAVVLECLGNVSRFYGSSKVVVRPPNVRCDKRASPNRRDLAERALGATVFVARDETTHTGQVIFADYDSLDVLVAGERLDFFASLREVQILSLCKEPLDVVHGVRLNPWRYGTGWEGCQLNKFNRVERVSELVEERFAA